MLVLRPLKPDDWPLWRRMRIEALREAPYAFGATLENWQGAGDTEERWRDRLSTVPYNVVAEVDGVPSGMASGVVEDGSAELISMWVAPRSRGRGVGDALVEAVVDWARAIGLPRIVLSVRDGNAHAAALYRRHGFQDAGPSPESKPPEPAERLMVRVLAD